VQGTGWGFIAIIVCFVFAKQSGAATLEDHNADRTTADANLFILVEWRRAAERTGNCWLREMLSFASVARGCIISNERIWPDTN